ncbi:unnamed protein product [Urochloa humidicola]
MAKAGLLLLALMPLLSLLPSSPLALNQDFCIADLSATDTPAGYPCKPPASVTADDFFYSGLGTSGPPLISKIALGSATVAKFPGVNGLAISAADGHGPRRRCAVALPPRRLRAPLRPRGQHRQQLHQRHAQQGLHQDPAGSGRRRDDR